STFLSEQKKKKKLRLLRSNSFA
ncbi:hypothetical protein EE612_056308, partial [Oryza sativa]